MGLRNLVLTTASVAALATVAVPAASATTSPNAFVTINVTMTDSKFVLARDSGPQGDDARFVIRDTGKKPHAFTLGNPKATSGHQPGISALVQPGHDKILIVYLDYRGPLTYYGSLAADRSNSHMRGVFTVT